MCNTGGCCHDHSRERPEECCHGVKIDRFLNKCPNDPCDPCDRDCQDEPCVGYGCPITLYDKCVLYSGDELVVDGMPRIKFYHTQRPYRTLKNRLPYQVEEAFMGNK